MKLNVSERERGALFALLNGEAWGGTEDALLVRDDLYTALGLSFFEGRSVGLDSLGNACRTYELSDAGVAHLREALAKPGQQRPLARVTAPLLRRLIPLATPLPVPRDLDEAAAPAVEPPS